MNSPIRKIQQTSYKLRKRGELRTRVLEYLLENPCIICGEDDPIVLEFDHRGDKIMPISRMVNDCLPISRILKEIKKCDVMCANCHRRKTHKQLGFWKQINK